MCGRCWQRHPDGPFIHAANLRSRLVHPPPWLDGFAAYVAARHCPARAIRLLGGLGRLVQGAPASNAQALLEASRRPGRSMGSLARALEAFLVDQGLARPLDQPERLAQGRRARRIEATPSPLRPGVAAFADHLLRQRQRALRAGTRPRSDITIEAHLATLRDLARFLVHELGITAWTAVDAADLEAFLALQPNNRSKRVGGLRAFFGWSRTGRLTLIDPSRNLRSATRRGFRGEVLDASRQRLLLQRWQTGAEVHPHESLVGVLALIHGASLEELRGLRLEDIDQSLRTLRLGKRAQRLPLDPASWAAVTRAVDHRATLRTFNPHLIVTKITATGVARPSVAYLAHILDPAGVRPRVLRSTRIADLVIRLDPKLVSTAFGMRPEGAAYYLAGDAQDDLFAEANL